jgi:hypothetical protein
MIELITQLEEELEIQKKQYLDKSADKIKRYLKQELAEKYYGEKGRAKYALEDDPQIDKAIDVIVNHAEYKKILVVH